MARIKWRSVTRPDRPGKWLPPEPGYFATITMARILIALLSFLLALPLSASADEFGDAMALFNKGSYAPAFKDFKRLADQGNSDAQLKLALMYHYGLGVKEDDKSAFKWMKKAAEQANAEAQYQLANFYLYGFGVPGTEHDPDLNAVQWYFKAALQGHAEAQYSLGLMFLAGKGVESSPEEGVKWITRAAEQGNPGAQSFLGTYK
jgi:uncharacterized protein